MPNVGEDGMREAREIKAKLIVSYESADKNLYLQEDTRLHKLLIALTGNKLIQDLNERIYALEHLSRTIALYSYERFTEYQKEHLGIIDGLLEGDVEKALTYHERHLRLARDESIRLLQLSAKQTQPAAVDNIP